MIDKFIKKFTEDKLDYEKIGDKFFLANQNLSNFKSDINLVPEHVGIFLGEEKNNKFSPSCALADTLSPITDKKVGINDKAEWLFLCGRDVFETSTLKGFERDMVAIIQNARDEVLGFGVARNSEINPIIDKGDFLRREK